MDELNVGFVDEAPHIFHCAFHPKLNLRGHKLQSCKPGFAMELLQIVLPNTSTTSVEYLTFGSEGITNDSLMHGIVHGLADISLPILHFNDDRYRVAEYLSPSFTGFQQAYLVNPSDHYILLPVFSPFQIHLWILGFGLFILIGGHITLLWREQINMVNLEKSQYEMAFRQKNTRLWKSTSEKIVITVWSLMAKLMTILFCMYFVRVIIPPSPALTASYFDNIYKADSLVYTSTNCRVDSIYRVDMIYHDIGHSFKVANKLKKGYKFVVINDSALTESFVNHKELGTVFREHIESSPYSRGKKPSVYDLINYTLHHKNTIFVIGVEILTTMKRQITAPKNDATFVVRDKLIPPNLYNAVARKELFSKSETKKITKRIIDVRQFGFVEKLSRMYDIDDQRLERQLSWVTPTKLRDPVSLELVFKFGIILGFGFILALIVLVMETVNQMSEPRRN